MTRVISRATSAHALRARDKPKIRKHKIIMESITQEKKKLRSVISFEAKAPPGYTFIPAGNPQFTNACKEICRKEALKVYTVTTTPHQRTHNLSQQVHRIGCHFPSAVVATVCMEQGMFLSQNGKLMPYQQNPYDSSANLRRARRADSEVSQNTINTEARDAIRDLFPNIPTKDLNQIIKTAFQKGKRKVGTAVELPLARRVQLAVVAHIRHVYTQYDRLLKITSFQEARKAVEEPCLAMLVRWRGDEENGTTVLEDVFREVIVISDDEDEDDSDSYQVGDADVEGRDLSVEIISTNPVAGEIHTTTVNYGASQPTDQDHLVDVSEDDAPSGFRFVPQPPRRRKAADQKRPDRRGFSRYQAWDRARDKYGGNQHVVSTNTPAEHPVERHYLPASTHNHLIEPSRIRHAPVGSVSNQTVTVKSPQRRPFTPIDETHGATSRLIPLDKPSVRRFHDSETGPPDVIRLPDGSIFERADDLMLPRPISNTSRPSNLRPIIISPNAAPMPSEQVRYRAEASSSNNNYNYNSSSSYNKVRPHHGADLNESLEHRVLPSIERYSPPTQGRQSVDPPPLTFRKRAPSAVFEDLAPRRLSRIEEISGQVNLIDINDRETFTRKRQRMDLDPVSHRAPPGENRWEAPRPVFVPDSNETVPTHQIASQDAYNARGLDRTATSVHDRNTFLYPEHSVLLDRQLERIPVGNEGPSHAIPRRIHHSGDIYRESGCQNKAPPLPESPLRLSSRNQLVMSSTSLPAFHDSGYRVREDGTAVGSDPLSHFNRLAPYHIAFEDREGPRVSDIGPYRDASHLRLGRHTSPGGGQSLHDPDNSTIYSHDFVRPVQLQEEDPHVTRSSRRPAPQGEQQPNISRSRFARYDKAASRIQLDGPRSPQWSQSGTRVPPSEAQPTFMASPAHREDSALQYPHTLASFRELGQPHVYDGRYECHDKSNLYGDWISI
ncbi:hypothetical protein AJ80_08311 [Polytolypa hystricis UAMH7299]|uniref:DUF2293 domain-containing protein n=1 Tax=Polytolypa hystricis (strain UAMH7299) TaxID=1447883 RepID=A0A2B7X9P2_POLH7|nr:hypothetical protein AJ80_08311 [Polytolypa hystricis UAMH7299]